MFKNKINCCDLKYKSTIQKKKGEKNMLKIFKLQIYMQIRRSGMGRGVWVAGSGGVVDVACIT